MKPIATMAAAVAMGMAAAMPVEAKVTHLLPRPQQVEVQPGAAFSLGAPVALNDPTGCVLLQEFLAGQGCGLTDTGRPVTVRLVDAIEDAYDHQLPDFDNEAYRLTVTPDSIEIDAVTPTGVIRATQTLMQMAEGYDGQAELEAVTITDWPAFKLRGFMHDVGRSFISPDELVKQIGLYGRFKVNTFHWHMTENQAWRFAVDAYPQLTSAESMTRYPGRYYSHDDIRRVMEEANKWGITVIPEVDMPGHSAAFERAMGFEMQTEKGKEVLLKVIEEMAGVFAESPYLHIGGDEKTITDNTFLPTMSEKVHSLGKKAICWNPISGVSITPALGFDMTQMWSSAGRKISGMPSIDCRYNYTNHFDVFADLVGIYKSSIYYSDRGTPEIAGTISCPWNDRKLPTEADIMRQNNTFANTLASAERAWIGGGKQYIETGGTTLPNSGPEYDEFADFERRLLFHKDHSLRDEPVPYVRQTDVRWMITDPFPNSGNASLVLPPETEEPAVEYTYNGKTYGTQLATGAGIYLRHTWGSIVPAFYATDPGTGNTAYAYTYIYSPVDQTAGALIEFQNYSRSEKDSNPEQGKWDRKGSRIWLNDREILPPVWTGTGTGLEDDLGNQNMTARDPMPIELKEGWNKVLIKLPYVAASGIRLNKWMFTFVVTEPDGRHALDGIIYSPTRSFNAKAESLQSLVSEIKAWLSRNFSDQVGFYPVSDQSQALAQAAETVAELLATDPDADVAALQEELSAMYEALKSSCIVTGINMPAEDVIYHMYTPLRDNRYVTSTGVGAGITGIVTPTDASAWEFAPRADGAFDIINNADGSYISPVATYNTQVKTTAARPDAGWSINKSDAIGYVTVVSGTVQLNQTRSGQSYKVFNWGEGTNIDDTGCKFKVSEVARVEPDPADIVPEPLVTLVDITLNGNAPYRVDPELAGPVLAIKSATSIALDYTTQTSNAAAAFAAASNSAAAAEYFSAAMLDGNRVGPRYIGLNNLTEGWYTQSCSPLGRHRMVLVADRADGYTLYLDGSLLRNIPASSLGDYGLSHFGNVAGGNADVLTLGGIITSTNGNLYPMSGTVHSARFWDVALTAGQISNLSYDDLQPTTSLEVNQSGPITVTAGINSITVTGNRSAALVYDATGTLTARGHGTLSVNPGLAIVSADGQTFKVIVR